MTDPTNKEIRDWWTVGYGVDIDRPWPDEKMREFGEWYHAQKMQPKKAPDSPGVWLYGSPEEGATAYYGYVDLIHGVLAFSLRSDMAMPVPIRAGEPCVRIADLPEQEKL